MNTLQALALPQRGRIQFRYQEPIVEEGLRRPLSENKLVGASVLLGYVDCHPDAKPLPTVPCAIVPFREATVIYSCQRGSFFVLHFELGPLRISKNLENFQRTLAANSPHWPIDTAATDPVGKWCMVNPSAFNETTAASIDETFAFAQQISEQLSTHRDFKNHPYYYMLEGIFRLRAHGTPIPVPLVNGAYRFSARDRYELRIVHWTPVSGSHVLAGGSRILVFDASAPAFNMIASSKMIVDSPYDVKTVALGSVDANFTTFGSLHLRPESGGAVDEEPIPDLHISAIVMGNLWRPTFQGLAVGALLALTQLAGLLTKGATGEHLRVGVVAVVLTGLITGLFASFGFRKPL